LSGELPVTGSTAVTVGLAAAGELCDSHAQLRRARFRRAAAHSQAQSQKASSATPCA